jgi:hypothetical protein
MLDALRLDVEFDNELDEPKRQPTSKTLMPFDTYESTFSRDCGKSAANDCQMLMQTTTSKYDRPYKEPFIRIFDFLDT